jgi:lipopolysaccharide/colanic/teichoic acid biosynthesis glycosyltransferase
MIHRLLIRVFDVCFALTGLLVLSPLALVIAVIVKADSRGPVFYRQRRVGRHGRDFTLYKFRTMRPDADRAGLLTVGEADRRITRSGIFLRRSKLDELPQLMNVLAGAMSLVGPRPEVRKYVERYDEEQRRILAVRPGITDAASIAYRDENAILGRADNPERTYVEEIMPAKLRLSMPYALRPTIGQYFSLILQTMFLLAGADRAVR